MKKEVISRIRSYIRSRRKRNRFLAVLSVLSLIVAFGTFYALSMPALTLDSGAVGEMAYGEEVTGTSSEASPSPAATPSNTISTPPEMDDTASPAPSPSPESGEPAPQPSLEIPQASEPAAVPSVLPLPSALPEDAAKKTNSNHTYIFEEDDLTVRVTLKEASDIPEDAKLKAVRVTGKNSAENGTADLDGIESALGISGKSNFEYYLLQFIVDGTAVALPRENKLISITDSKVGKKYGARAVYGVLDSGGAASLFKVDNRNIASAKQEMRLSASDAFSGLVVYWYRDATLEGAGVQTAEPVLDDAANGGYEEKLGGAGSTGAGRSVQKPGNRTHFEFDNDGLSVTAELSDPGAIPEGADLSASRITKDNDFWGYLTVYLRLFLNGYIKSGDEFYFYDIHFDLNGQEIEPSGGSVAVSVEDEAYESGFVNAYKALHMKSDNHIQWLSLEPVDLHKKNKIKFSVNEFSTFIVLPPGSRLSFDLVEEASDTFTNTAFYIPDRPLGMAGNFHIVAFDTATLSAHTNGNVLAQTCNAYSNFGTNNLAEEVSYIQDYTHVHPSSASSTDHILALGSDNVITLMDNGNAFGVNGTKLDRPYNILQDDDTSVLQFVNMNLVESEFRSIALSFSGKSDANIDTAHLSTTGGSCDLSYIELTDPDRVGVFNITASQLNQYGYLGVKGFVSGGEGTVFINVDCTGFSGTVHIPNSEMSVDNSWLNFQERTTFIYGRILWNFINCTGDIETGRVYGSIVAPDAHIKVYQNVNGSIIGNNVTIYAESHRDDFVGNLTDVDTITVNKIWLDQDDSTLPASEVADLTVEIQPYWSNNHGNTWHSNTADQFVLNSANNWSYSWTQPGNKTYLWRVEEIAMYDSQGTDISGNFTASYSSNNVSGVTNGLIYVYNKITYTLPDTGGVTAKPFTIAGILIMSIALYIYYLFKRRRKHKAHVESG